MQKADVTEFSGSAGRVLKGSISVGSMITGIALGTLVLGGSLALLLAGAHGLIVPFVQGIMALALARFATNGLFGEWDGTIFSDAGGPWSEVGQVAIRYMTMSSVWMLPLVVISLRMQKSIASGMMMMDPALAAKLMLLASVSFMAMALTPPLFMIISVGADNFGDIFSADHWKSMLSGRLGDLLAVYAVYSGGLVVLMFLCMLPMTLASAINEKLGMLVSAIAFCLVFGVAVDLLGRLCGFFARGDLGLAAKTEPLKASSAPSNAPVRPKKPVQPSLASIPVAADPLMPGSAAKAQSGDPAKAASPDLGATADGGKKPPLMDAQQRVARALNRFDHDPQGAISALVEMRNTFAAHPQVEQALTLCLFRSGQTDAALTMAKGALPLCLERGHSQLAAVIYKEMGAKLDPQELNGEQLIAIAAALAKMEEWMTAARAYVKIIEQDPGEARAIKGMLQVADGILYKKSKPEAAAKIYRYMLANCSPSPFVTLMQDGLKESEKRMSKPV